MCSGIRVSLAPNTDPLIKEINRVGLSTLKECMQTVYEDGPKRDMRLWIGDLYLEALANAYSYQNNALTKRCLYLLAGLAKPSGILNSNISEVPTPRAQNSVTLDYCLLYNVALHEYLKASGDKRNSRRSLAGSGKPTPFSAGISKRRRIVRHCQTASILARF